jgi:hypothetical protein
MIIKLNKIMVLVTDIVFQFVTTEFVPRIVMKTVELYSNGSSAEDIVKEICALDFSTDPTKTSTKRSYSSKPSTKTVIKVEPKTIEEFKEAYTENYTDFEICTHVYTRGGEKLKGKICCGPLDMSFFNKDDKKTRRCSHHKDADSKVDIDSLLRPQTPSKKDQVDKTRKMFPKGSPEVLNGGVTTTPPSGPASSSSTPNSSVVSAGSGLGKISTSIKDQLAKKTLVIDDKTPTKESDRERTPEKERTPTPVKAKEVTPPKTDAKKKLPQLPKAKPKEVPKERTPTPVKERTPTPVKDQTPSPRRSSSPSCAQTPKSVKDDQDESVHSKTSSDRESTPDTKAEVPKDENGEEYLLNPSQPSAEKYLWMMYSDKEVLVFSDDFKLCYGVYKSEDKINPKKTLKLSSAWKRLLKKLDTLQESFVTERGIEIRELE